MKKYSGKVPKEFAVLTLHACERAKERAGLTYPKGTLVRPWGRLRSLQNRLRKNSDCPYLCVTEDGHVLICCMGRDKDRQKIVMTVLGELRSDNIVEVSDQAARLSDLNGFIGWYLID